ncbi:MAG: sigma 54-interacting transcriptional regulator [Myxococcota bacterium]|nr:sigma 54-interacting transcriptional regulator [Myxococcota bacterium]
MSSPERTSPTEKLSVVSERPNGFRLVVLEGADAGRTFEVERGQAVVGKSSSADLRLSDAAASGRHASFEVVDDGVRVVDLASTNGTHYLGEAIPEAVVKPGAVITIGRSRVAVLSREPAAGPGYSARSGYGGFVGDSPAMRQLYALLERLEPTEYTVLIEGETGSGKEVAARAIHDASPRRDRPFVVFDCGAVSRDVVASELFGHTRGAFTGASTSRVGVFEAAHGGTVFLDEIGELPVELQPKLLRVLEEGELRNVGGNDVRRVDVRVIAATNRSLEHEVQAKRFREDLYFRLNVVRVALPPLRKRREDIPMLVRHLVRDMGGDELVASASTLELFTSAYDWPGNVRELRNTIAHIMSVGTMPRTLERPSAEPIVNPAIDEPFNEAKRRLVDAFERDYFGAQLRAHEGNIARAARASGVDRAYFKRLLRRHGLLPNRDEEP